jgi:hypothetical protein
LRGIDVSGGAAAHTAQPRRDIDQHWFAREELLRQFHRQFVAVQLYERSCDTTVRAIRPEHISSRETARLRAITPPIWWYHRVEDVRLHIKSDLTINEHRQQLFRCQPRINGFIGCAWTTPNVCNAKLAL